MPSLESNNDRIDAPSSRKKSTQKRAAIIEGAMQVFLANGYAATSMDRVAAIAGVSKATVYSHFQDKAALFDAIVRQLAQEKFESGFDPRNEPAIDGEPRVVLRQVAEDILSGAEVDSRFCEFMRLIVGESGRFPELSEPYVQSAAKPLIVWLTKYFSSQKSLRIDDPEATARVFAGTLIYFVLMQRILGGDVLMPMDGDRIIQTLLNLVSPKR